MGSVNKKEPLIATWDSKAAPAHRTRGTRFSSQSPKPPRRRISKRTVQKTGDLESYESTRRNKRVWKACERCRMKKIKCDGQFPCQRCNDDGLICTTSARKRSGYKQLPKGYAEVLENTQLVLVATIRKLYQMIRNGDKWKLGEPRVNERGQAIIHNIAQKLACVRVDIDVDLHIQSLIPEEQEGLESLAHLLEQQQSSLDHESEEINMADCFINSNAEEYSASATDLFNVEENEHLPAAFGTLIFPQATDSLMACKSLDQEVESAAGSAEVDNSYSSMTPRTNKYSISISPISGYGNKPSSASDSQCCGHVTEQQQDQRHYANDGTSTSASSEMVSFHNCHSLYDNNHSMSGDSRSPTSSSVSQNAHFNSSMSDSFSIPNSDASIELSYEAFMALPRLDTSFPSWLHPIESQQTSADMMFMEHLRNQGIDLTMQYQMYQGSPGSHDYVEPYLSASSSGMGGVLEVTGPTL